MVLVILYCTGFNVCIGRRMMAGKRTTKEDVDDVMPVHEVGWCQRTRQVEEDMMWTCGGCLSSVDP